MSETSQSHPISIPPQASLDRCAMAKSARDCRRAITLSLLGSTLAGWLRFGRASLTQDGSPGRRRISPH